MGALVRHGDDQWRDVVSWSLKVMIIAEELDISSKNIRQRIIQKEEIKNLLPLSVDHYIMKHRLYRNDSPPKVA